MRLFDGVIDASATRVHLAVDATRDYASVIHFKHSGRDVVYELSRAWGACFMQFMQRCASAHPEVGEMDAEGWVSSTPAQKLEAIKLFARDVVECLDGLVATNPRTILDYAVWRGEHPGTFTDTYASLIARTTFELVVHSHFIVDYPPRSLAEWAKAG